MSEKPERDILDVRSKGFEHSLDSDSRRDVLDVRSSVDEKFGFKVHDVVIYQRSRYRVIGFTAFRVRIIPLFGEVKPMDNLDRGLVSAVDPKNLTATGEQVEGVTWNS